jgi:tRNA A-37 threonylcarbamoyl transferase component Bud32
LNDEADIQASERVGTVLNDKWALERVLGIGGMATVYAARHRNGARAAVKVLHGDLSRHPEVRERFLREGYAANRVEHPGVVRVLDDDVIASGPDAGTAYLVMELLEGESLQERLERDPLMGEREFLVIASSVLDVLEAAHSRGVVHRDLKPENLFLLRQPGEALVKVLDFGLARLLQGQAITTYGLALGTPSFMSPEQAAGRVDEIDGRTDLFALAATGFRLRTGRRIHEGVNAVELVTKMANVAAPRIRALAPGVSGPFARVIDRALEFRREDRYPSASAMRDDVSRAIGELDAGVTATELAVLSPPPAAGERTIEVSARDLEPPRLEESIHIPRRRSLLPVFALLVFGGIGVKLWLDARHATRAAPATTLASAVASTVGVESPATFIPALDGGRDAAAEASLAATASGSAVSPVAPGPSAPATSASRRPMATPLPSALPGPAPRPGPGKAHKLPALHHASSTGTKSTR